MTRDPIYIDYLNAFDIEDLSNNEILVAIKTSLGSQGRCGTVIEPRVPWDECGRRPDMRELRYPLIACEMLAAAQDVD